jgi:hypothetical protein
MNCSSIKHGLMKNLYFFFLDDVEMSPGIDQFLAVFIKAGGRKIRCQIRKLINSIWIYEELPEE